MAATSVKFSPALYTTHTLHTRNAQIGAPRRSDRGAASTVKPFAKSKGSDGAGREQQSNSKMSEKAQAGTPMTPDAASRIQAAEAKAGDGGVKAGGFASRAQAAAARNEGGGSKGGSPSAEPSSGGKGDKGGK